CEIITAGSRYQRILCMRGNPYDYRLSRRFGGETKAMRSVLYIVILSSVLQESPGTTIEDQTYVSLLARARAEYLVGSFAQSEACFISALPILPRADETTRASVLSELGDLYVNEDKLGKAETAYRESLAIYKKAPDKAKVALLLRHLGALYSLQRRD